MSEGFWQKQDAEERVEQQRMELEHRGVELGDVMREIREGDEVREDQGRRLSEGRRQVKQLQNEKARLEQQVSMLQQQRVVQRHLQHGSGVAAE